VTSADLKDEDAFENPTKVRAGGEDDTVAGRLSHEFPPYSLSVIRLKTGK